MVTKMKGILLQMIIKIMNWEKLFSQTGHTVTSSTYIKQHLPVAPL